MFDSVFQYKLQGLREGELRLLPAGESGLSQYASTALYELRCYVAALEAGYRKVCEIVDGYRKEAEWKERRLEQFREKNSGIELKDVKNLIANQWSEGACLGYAAMAFRQSGLSPEQAVGLLELMADLMEEYSLEQAAEAHQAIISGRDAGSEE